MSVKTTLSSIGNGLLDGAVAVTTAMNNGPINTRITEIDEEIAKLQDEKTSLQKKLI